MIEETGKKNILEKEIDMNKKLSQLEEEMSLAAESLEFERAAELRDQILILKEKIK